MLTPTQLLPILSLPPTTEQSDAALTAIASMPPPGVLPPPNDLPALLNTRIYGLPITVKQAGLGALGLWVLSKVFG